MLTIVIPEQEAFDEKSQRFVKISSHTIKLEHSLLSLQKWESKHKKYFIDNKELTSEEILDYIKCMTLNQVDDYVYEFLTKENINQIMDYIKDPMTATFFYEDPNKPKTVKKEIITAELIYSSMIILGIPVDIFEKRHLNHVLTLIRVCSEKENPDSGKNKMSSSQLAQRYSELNKARKAKLKTRG